MNVGILALHGNIQEHQKILESLGVTVQEVRTSVELNTVDRLLIPGGESTVISKLIWQTDLAQEIQQKCKNGMPVFGTCAGAIMIAAEVVDSPKVQPLQLLDITIDRNAYGRQVHSFDADLQVSGIKNSVHVSFIRAPIITAISNNVAILSTVNSSPVIVRSGNVLACTCHPEVHGESGVHKIFLDL